MESRNGGEQQFHLPVRRDQDGALVVPADYVTGLLRGIAATWQDWAQRGVPGTDPVTATGLARCWPASPTSWTSSASPPPARPPRRLTPSAPGRDEQRHRTRQGPALHPETLLVDSGPCVRPLPAWGKGLQASQGERGPLWWPTVDRAGCCVRRRWWSAGPVR